jgi:hypothetical protein
MAGKIFRRLQVAAVVALCAAPATAIDDRNARAANGFDWFANAAKPVSNAEAIARTRAAIVKARTLSKGATWVCSPAGSGQRASCHKG